MMLFVSDNFLSSTYPKTTARTPLIDGARARALSLAGALLGTRQSATTKRLLCGWWIIASISGCSSYIDPNVPEMIRPHVEPRYNGEYLLYRPSQYTRNASWPLVVLCHSSYPDSPDKLIREWTQFAEAEGFLVAAPRLQRIGGFLSSKPSHQIARLKEEERRILALIQHVRAGHEVSQDRIFLYGRSGGAHSTLYTGLKNPDIIRAIAVSNPKFNAEFLTELADAVDPYQPVFVEYRVSERMTGNHAKRCLEWLRSHGAELTVNSSADARTDAAPLVGFFENVIRSKPWIHIRALPGTGRNGLEVRFGLLRSFDPVQTTWDFGDGQHVSGLEPVSTYAKPGSYRVTVTLEHPDGTRHRRSAMLSVPELVLFRSVSIDTDP